MRELRSVLTGQRESGGTVDAVAVELIARVGDSRFRVRTLGRTLLRPGDRLRFGDSSNRVCLLGTLNAAVASVSADDVELEFEFHGSALDEMIDAVTE